MPITAIYQDTKAVSPEVPTTYEEALAIVSITLVNIKMA